jgi:hypothetical protein
MNRSGAGCRSFLCSLVINCKTISTVIELLKDLEYIYDNERLTAGDVR